MASCRTLCARGFHKACAKAEGRGEPHGGKSMVEMDERSLAEMQANGLIATGLVPVFPKEARCAPIASPFGSHTSYDGSIRTPKGNFGYHGGIDISLPIGTPILSISDGTVIGKRHGGRLVGNELMVRQSLADTGLPVWTFTKYKHFSRLPRVKIGERVHRGQIIGLSGNTGTVGGHYGSRGYAHLHMSTYSNADGRYTVSHGRG
jgi:murein DD-endopeptidase MepM/ murein hydrolase activator NlpD